MKSCTSHFQNSNSTLTLTSDSSQKSVNYQKGFAMLEHLHGGHAGKQMVMELEDICPEFVTTVIEWGFGQVATRTGIDLITRELVIIASCITLGHAIPQLKAHVEAALKIGASKQQIIEVVLQMSVYAGFASASNAFRIVKEVFNESKCTSIVGK